MQATQVFADFGAEVVQVEPPGGCALRAHPAFPFWARGRQSMVLDLHDGTDAAVARGLCGGADVVVETFRPGVAEGFGLGYEDLAADNSRLVYGSVTGFGRTGPLAHRPAYEGVVMAMLGGFDQLQEMTTRPGPSFCSAPYATYPAAQLLAQGVLAALVERESSGLGQRVDTSLLAGLSVHDTFNWFSRVVARRYPGSFEQTPVSVNGVPTGGLTLRLLIALTADGRWLQFSQTAPRLFEAMMTAFELDWMFADPRFATAPEIEDLDRRIEFWEILLNTVRSKTYAEWLAVFDKHPDVWGEVFRRSDDALDHPQVQWNHTVEVIEDSRLGPVRQPGPIVRLDDTPARLKRSAPALGEHDPELLSPRRGPAPRPATATGAAHGPPLQGITCLELGSYYAAPYGATLLAELGARVIKLEELSGDPMRNMLPFPEIAGIKALQGKQSIAVDITTPAGRDVVLALAASADIILQSFRAGVAERLGLGPAAMRAVNPDLVYLSSPGYGDGGPCGRRPAYAPTIGAAAGLAWRNAGASIPESENMELSEIKSASMRLVMAVMGVGNADGFASVTAGTALVLGLLARARGAGAHELHTSMLTSASHALSEVNVSYRDRPEVPVADPGLHGFNARYRLYETADGWVFIAAPTDAEAARLAAVLAPYAAIDPYATDDELVAVLSALFRTRPATDWEADLIAGRVACAVVAPGPVESNYMDDGRPGQLCGMVTKTWHPILEEHERLAPLVSMSRSGTVAGSGCLVGEHTDAVLTELGYTSETITELRSAGVIG
jgi:crotonobetainyl-CoA:carnitine CoA-transferase CaiB-like acyl-CoA transferase